MLTSNCPRCGGKLGIAKGNLGGKLRCPYCNEILFLPSPVSPDHAAGKLVTPSKLRWYGIAGVAGAILVAAFALAALLESKKKAPPESKPVASDPVKLKATAQGQQKPEIPTKQPAKMSQPAAPTSNIAALEAQQKKIPFTPPASLAPSAKAGEESEAEQLKAVAVLIGAGKSDATVRGLCELAISNSAKVRNAALEGLEKLSPKLFHPVLSLLVEDQRFHPEAMQEILEMGEQGKQALPVLFAYSRRAPLMQFVTKERRTENVLSFLGKVALTEPETLAAALRVAKNAGRDSSHHIQALCLLGAIAKENKKSVDIIIAQATAALSSKDLDVAVAAVWILREFSEDSKDVLRAIRALRFCENPVIRSAALSAIGQIEAKGEPFLYSVDLVEKCHFRETRYLYIPSNQSVRAVTKAENGSEPPHIYAMSRPGFIVSGQQSIVFDTKHGGFFDITVSSGGLYPSKAKVRI